MKKILVVLILIATAGMAFAQISAGEPDAANIGVDTAQQRLKEVSISKFEDAGFWSPYLSKDIGVITMRRHAGSPIDKTPLEEEVTIGIEEQDDYVLGVKVEFFRRGAASFYIDPIRPLAIEGITKTISMWVVGRNTNHTLYINIQDHAGRVARVRMGKLNFTGWKRLTVAVPSTLIQRDYHYSNKMGVKILGFEVECDIPETYGSYYIYFDDLRATTDLFAEESRDPDDIGDTW